MTLDDELDRHSRERPELRPGFDAVRSAFRRAKVALLSISASLVLIGAARAIGLISTRIAMIVSGVVLLALASLVAWLRVTRRLTFYIARRKR